MSATVDLTGYEEHILAEEDRPLFQDAVASAEAGALRAAYVMIWLACAESLKRRFREAQKRDGAAGKIVGEIEAKEKEHKSVDKLVLDKAKEYGFLSDPGHTVLTHVYDMRCLYGHPYEEAPSAEQVSHAAAVVVEHVLSKPVTLKHGFGKELLKSLLEDRSYLDDQQDAVHAFAKDMIPRLDDSVHGWLLDAYWADVEAMADDSSMGIFVRRGTWFSRAMLTEVGIDVFSRDDWHDRASRFPKTLMRVCTTAEVFRHIGKRAQDSLVGAILAESGTRASALRNLERLNDAGALTKRQRERFLQHITEMSSIKLRSSRLSTSTCFDSLVEALESHDWYVQNPAVELIASNGPGEMADLTTEQQAELGRNILQAAEGNARSAKHLIRTLADGDELWPYDFVRGMALECFTNEDNDIRFKDKPLEEVLSALSHLKMAERKKIIAEIAASVDIGTPKAWVDAEGFEDVIKTIGMHSWAGPLVGSLEAKAAALPDEEDGDES